jgi:hypothetical protein
VRARMLFILVQACHGVVQKMAAEVIPGTQLVYSF